MKKLFFVLVLMVGLLFAFEGNTHAATPAAKADTALTKADTALNTAVNVITTVLPGVKVDTINDVQDIIKPGTYLIQNVPHKGATWQSVVSWVFGLIGLIIGVVFYLRHKKLKDVLAQLQGKQ